MIIFSSSIQGYTNNGHLLSLLFQHCNTFHSKSTLSTLIENHFWIDFIFSRTQYGIIFSPWILEPFFVLLISSNSVSVFDKLIPFFFLLSLLWDTELQQSFLNHWSLTGDKCHRYLLNISHLCLFFFFYFLCRIRSPPCDIKHRLFIYGFCDEEVFRVLDFECALKYQNNNMVLHSSTSSIFR